MTAQGPPAPTGAPPEIRSLTGLRGIAAAYVVVFHFTGNGQVGSGALRQVFVHGYLAVDVFFVLSGYVMALNYGRLFSRAFQGAAYRTFLMKRVCRVYPLFAATTLVCAALSVVDPAMEGPLTAWTLAVNLPMVQAWGLSYSLNYPGWSISTEFAAYLVFPVLAGAVLRGRPARAWAAAMVAVGMLIVVATRSAPELQEVGSRLGPLDAWSASTLYPVLRCLGGFALGVTAWRLSGLPWVRQAAKRRLTGTALCLAAALLLAMPGTDVAVVALGAALIVSLAEGTSIAARCLGAGPVHWLGTVSYSLYLVHYPLHWGLGQAVRGMLEALGAPRPAALASVALVALSVAAAAATYRWIERPCRNLWRLVPQGRPAVPKGVAAEP